MKQQTNQEINAALHKIYQFFPGYGTSGVREACEWLCERSNKLGKYEQANLTPEQIAAMQAELAAYRQAEAEGKKYERWNLASKRLPNSGETVEIMRVSDRIMAVYEPEENHHCPWRLIDFRPNGIWRRSKDAVTHWRTAIERGE